MPGYILLVDDDRDFRYLLKEMLTPLSTPPDGLKILEAENGEVALSMLPLFPVKMVISDYEMPRCNGLEFLRRLRQEQNESLPFLLVTGVPFLVEARQASKLGADGFIPKPVSQEDLVEAVKSVLEHPEKTLLYKSIALEKAPWTRELPWDLYVRLGDEKYLRVERKGQRLDQGRKKLYESYGVDEFFFRTEERKPL